MGYAYYLLPDGREAGYGVNAECDFNGCKTEIDRGMGWLCGRSPDGWREESEPGCGKYFCGQHGSYQHECENPPCDYAESDGDWCNNGTGSSTRLYCSEHG